jgi:hypothetical protein
MICKRPARGFSGPRSHIVHQAAAHLAGRTELLLLNIPHRSRFLRAALKIEAQIRYRYSARAIEVKITILRNTGIVFKSGG